MPPSSITPLASSQVIRSGHDVISIELHEPDDRPAFPIIGTPPINVLIVWPAHPTVVDPTHFPDVAATVAQLFARAHVVLAALKADRRL